MRQRIRSPVCKSEKHTSVVATVAPETSGVPHAVVLRLASCSPRQRPQADAVVSAEAAASGRKQTGQTGFRRTTRLGPARTHEPATCRHASGPHPAWSSTLVPGPHAPSVRGTRPGPITRARRCRATASRPASRDDRDTPLTVGRDAITLREVSEAGIAVPITKCFGVNDRHCEEHLRRSNPPFAGCSQRWMIVGATSRGLSIVIARRRSRRSNPLVAGCGHRWIVSRSLSSGGASRRPVGSQ